MVSIFNAAYKFLQKNVLKLYWLHNLVTYPQIKIFETWKNAPNLL